MRPSPSIGTKQTRRLLWGLVLLIIAIPAARMIHRVREESERVKFAALWLRAGPSLRPVGGVFVLAGNTNAEIAVLPLRFRESDWAYLIHEGLRPSTRWEEPTRWGESMRWYHKLGRHWPFSLLYCPYGDQNQRRQLLLHAWRLVRTQPTAIRILALRDAAMPGVSVSESEQAIELALNSGPITSDLAAHLKSIAALPEVPSRERLLQCLRHPERGSDMNVVREILVMLSADRNSRIAKEAADLLLPPQMLPGAVERGFLDRPPSLPISISSPIGEGR